MAADVSMIYEGAARNAVVRAVWPEREDVRVLFFVGVMAVAPFSFTEAHPSFSQTGGRSIHLTRRQSQRPDLSGFCQIEVSSTMRLQDKVRSSLPAVAHL